MTTQHTPGPWRINTDQEYNGARIDGLNGRSVAHATQRDHHPTLGMGISQTEAMVNAHLIAAAPDLLGACRSALRALRDNLSPGCMDADAIAGLEAAIAKATGQ